MKNLVFSFIIILHITSFYGQKRKLVWQDNFNGTTLNEKNWNFELGDGCPNICGWGNNEKQIYTNKNYKVANGKLTIIAKNDNNIFTSTKITSKNKKQFQYGRIETRAKLPLAKGTWPAFWMLGSNIDKVNWPKCGEIDILEYVGKTPNILYTSLHTQDSHGETINTMKTNIDGIQNGFHLYAVDWTKEKIEFFIDNKSVYVFNPKNKTDEIWPYNQSFYMIYNLAVGGNFGGNDIDLVAFPQEFVIDFVRVFQ